jgi:hypothetical protein
MAYGGYEGVVDRVAGLYRERLEATGTVPTISAPTNSDAHRIGERRLTQREMRSVAHMYDSLAQASQRFADRLGVPTEGWTDEMPWRCGRSFWWARVLVSN